jgi:hypothetical protein
MSSQPSPHDDAAPDALAGGARSQAPPDAASCAEDEAHAVAQAALAGAHPGEDAEAVAGSATAGAPRPPGEQDKTAIVVAILLAAGAILVIAVVVMNRQGSTQPRQLDYTPSIDVGMSSQEEIRSFTSKTAKEVTEIEATLGRLNQSMDGLMKRQDDTEGLVRETLKNATETFASQGSEKVRQMEAYAQESRQEDPRTTRIIDDFRSTLASLKESPAEARAHALLLLRQSGVPEERIRTLLAEAAQQAGRLQLGDIAEPPLSAREVETLPEWVRPLVPALHDTAYGLAQSEGRLYPQQILTDVRMSLRAHAHSQVLDPQLVERICQVVRVRRENLPQELQAVLPWLVTQRDSRHLGHEDQVGISHLVWSNRGRYPEGTTAGEMLSLCEVVARTIGASTNGVSTAQEADPAVASSGFRALDQATMVFAEAVVHAAMLEARQLGKDAQTLGSRALGNYLDTMRMTATPEQVQQVLRHALEGVAGATAPATPTTPATSSAPTTIAPGAAATAVPGESPAPQAQTPAPGSAGAPAGLADPDGQLYFGPLRLSPLQVQRALVFTIPGLLAGQGTSPQGVAGAAAVVGALEQIPRIVAQELPPHLGSPMGGLDFLQQALPEVIQAIHQATALAGIPLPVSPQHGEEQSPAAQLMRGVEIGAIYGPFLHDQQKATAAAPDAVRALEAHPPLDGAVSARLGALLGAAPYQAILTALEAARPGQCQLDAERFQGVVGALATLDDDARALEARVQGLLRSEDQGTFAENIRMLVPLSTAEHEQHDLPLPTLLALVRRDLTDYAVVFLAECRLSRTVMDDIVPRYAAAMSEESGGGATLVQDALAVVPSTIAMLYARAVHGDDPDVGSTVASLTEQAQPLVERRLVQQVVLSRVEPRLRHAGALDQPGLSQALGQVESAVQHLVAPPYTPARIDAWAATLSAQGLELLAPANPGLDTPHGARDSTRDNAPHRAFPAVTMLPTTTAGALVGVSTWSGPSRHIVIPANTYGNAHLQTGVDAEIGGRANVPVMLELDLCWNAPTGSRIAMRGCRVSGVANALAGPERVAIDLKHLSYVFPSGREFDAEIHGYVADNLSGEFGALGVYHWNADKVMPMAVVAGGFKGAADALKANSTTTIVGAAGTTAVSANQGSQWKEAAFGGGAGGFGIMSDYVTAVLSQVHPSVSAVNGQSVSVVILEPVEFTVPESEFSELSAGANGFSP